VIVDLALVMLFVASEPAVCPPAAGAPVALREFCDGEKLRPQAGYSADPARVLEVVEGHYRMAADLAGEPDLKDRALAALTDLYGGGGLERPDKLEAVLRERIALHPDQLGPHFALSRLQERQGRIAEAEQTLFAARQQQPASEEPFRMLAAFYARRVQALNRGWDGPQPPTPSFGDGRKVLKAGGNVHPPQ